MEENKTGSKKLEINVTANVTHPYPAAITNSFTSISPMPKGLKIYKKPNTKKEIPTDVTIFLTGSSE